ncbi:hypothetical protein [Phormidium sp. CCY1219]|uniref:hypothetical protein n=1 Tax=Phormidium sp. CCY1219 TaxID=2886104 RepID=UPI002D1EE2AB|nr:hypothetical protein [Phormidium sp. CCY1219]MEB3830870.1 hypothetical protein [Phormidium sp. CCY1219]
MTLNNLKRFGLLLCSGLMVLAGFSSAPAFGSDSSRISQLEAEIFTLRSQLNRLENEVSRLRRQRQFTPQISASEPTPEPATTPRPRRPQDLTLEEQFDNLAILAIELKERLTEVENRLDELETQIAP